MNEKIFPTILMVLDMAASFVYWTKGDYARMGYWGAAAVLTFCIMAAK